MKSVIAVEAKNENERDREARFYRQCTQKVNLLEFRAHRRAVEAVVLLRMKSN